MALKTFTAKNNATRAAKKALSTLGCSDPAAGEDFTITEIAGGKFTYTLAPQWMPQTEDDEPKAEADATVELLIEGNTITTIGSDAGGYVDGKKVAEVTEVEIDSDANTMPPEGAPPAPIEDIDLDALAPAPNPPKEKPAKPLSARAQAKADAEAAAKAGNLPEHLMIASAANPSYQKRADALRELAEAGDLDGLNAPINGVNTYASKLRAYRDLLVLAVTAKAAS